MSFKNSNIDWNRLIQLNENGIYIATYAEIRTAISEQFKQIYGEDIDLSTASADGIYVESLSLMISNILQSFKHFYSQLDVRTASGPYLDALCSLSNVYRKPATNSTCSVILTLDEGSTEDFKTNEIKLADRNGNIWSCSFEEQMAFKPGVPTSIVVTCEESGPVRADKGWIDRLMENNVVMSIEQTQNAIIGSYAESDSELRARRNSSLGATGKTVLATAIGTLYTINGIDDVKIYNNDTGNAIIALDGTNVQQHDVYFILKQKKNVSIADSLICSSIYEKMTPGIKTTNPGSNVKYGKMHSFRYIQATTAIDTAINQMVYWKEANPIKPKVTIRLTATSNYGSDTSERIGNAVISYLQSKALSSTFYYNDLWNAVMCADPKFRGQLTFMVNSIDIAQTDNASSDKANSFTLPDTYFDYSDAEIKASSSGNIVTIIIE